MKYLILLSTYNNEHNFLLKYEEILNSELDLDILIIDRGSTDRTKHFLRNNYVPRLELAAHASYFDAISLGLSYAYENKYDGVIEFDINGRFSVKDIPYLIATHENKKTDFILASRFLDKDNDLKRNDKTIRFVSNMFVKGKITDPTTRFKIFGKKAIKFFANTSTLSVPTPDRLIQMLRVGYTFYEVQIEMNRKFKRQNPHKWYVAIAETTSWIFSILFSNPFRKVKR